MKEREVVQLLRDLMIDDGETLRERDGPEAVTAARDLADFVSARLSEDVAQQSLWVEFREDPEGTAAELTGILEALVEADPGLALRMERYLEEYHRVLSPPGPRRVREARRNVKTEGGVMDISLTAEDATLDIEPQSDYGRGTYLRGNVVPGTQPKEPGVTFEAFEFRGQVVRFGPNAPDVTVLFQQLYETVEGRPDLNPEAQAELKTELQEVQALVALQEEEVDQEELARHLQNIERLSPDVLQLLLNGLMETDAGL